MCGISGIVTKESKKYEDRLNKMVASLNHRGPDGSGTYFFDNCALGHNRLAIVDLNTGAQPMLGNEMGITFNGEIYGYEKIRKDLESEYNFKTKSDTEVIMALYEKYNDNFLIHLPGMFSFALWDNKEKKLMAGRDRFGEKPFYYAFGKNGEFIFASEIKAILKTGLVEPEIDMSSIAHYLKRLYVSSEKTIYRNIFTLSPAHFLTLKNGDLSVKRYWNMPETNQQISMDEAVGTLKKLLDTSIEEQLIADVPVGAFLSGGLDSSTIVGVASKYKKGLKTFSFGFGESKNETHFANEISEKYKTDQTELQPGTHGLSDLLIKMQNVFDEPFADSSNIPTYLLSESAKKYVKVVLAGDGGDELFGGYSNWYKPLLSMKDEKGNSKVKTAILYFLAKTLFKLNFANTKKIQNLYLGSRFKNKYKNIIEAHNNQNVTFSDPEIKSLFIKEVETPKVSVNFNETDTLGDAFRMDIQDYMPGDILVKIDRASMAHGLELRSPFLNQNFAEFAISLPWNMKINKREDKVIFRKAFSDLWTEKIKNRTKQGFGSPISEFLKDKGIIALKKKILLKPESKIYKILSYDACMRFANSNNQKTWTLLVLALWMENHNFSI